MLTLISCTSFEQNVLTNVFRWAYSEQPLMYYELNSDLTVLIYVCSVTA